jgi:hypothetical protein
MARLLAGDGVLALPPRETRQAGFFTALPAPEERLRGLLQPRHHVLEEVRVDGVILGDVGADGLQFGLLLLA